MKVEKTHHVDASEPDADGDYDYYYEYDIYRFSMNGQVLIARAYSDEPNEASFQGFAVPKEKNALIRSDLDLEITLAAKDYLETEGKTEIRWLSNGGYALFPGTREPAWKSSAKYREAYFKERDE